MKPLFITIDTEGDNLWSNNNATIYTENSRFIPRFQELCEKYGLIPIWLTDYEMACDKRFVDYMNPKVQMGLCEVGLHLHAKNSPPIVDLESSEGDAAYLIEYKSEIMESKLRYLKDLLEKEFLCKIITHRAGRWALNNEYLSIIERMGLLFDCSVTPGIDWSSHKGRLCHNKWLVFDEK